MQDKRQSDPGPTAAPPTTKASCGCCAPVGLGDAANGDAASGDAAACAIVDGVQEVRITVKGGYSPSSIALTRGVPARLVFAREETSRCSEELLIPAFGVRAALPAHSATVVELTPTEDGIFGFSCGMQMLRGELVVA